MRSGAFALLLLGGLLGGCPPAPVPSGGEAATGRYVIGDPYVLDGRWYYPREDPSYAGTGLATVAADVRAGRSTANGEAHDPARSSAGHRTLPLPSVLRITNLENGRDLLVRANDRAPAHPGRVVELSRRAADLLGVRPGRPVQVRVAVDADLSRAAAAPLPSAEPRGPRVETVPVAAIARESLAPPPGARGTAGREAPASRPDLPEAAAAAVILPERVTEGLPAPGRLVIAGSTFGGRDAAARQAARIGGAARAVPVSAGRRTDWSVRAGPYATVEEADRALDAALRSGVSEARILVE